MSCSSAARLAEREGVQKTDVLDSLEQLGSLGKNTNIVRQ